MYDRLRQLENKVAELATKYALLTKKMEQFITPLDKTLETKMVVKEMSKGNMGPWKEMQERNRNLMGLTRKKGGRKKVAK